MKNQLYSLCLLFLLLCLTACSKPVSSNNSLHEIEMELTENFDTADPFIDERLFSVSDSVETLEMNLTFQMDGGSGMIEITDSETNDILWNNTWIGTVEETASDITLNHLEKEKEYIIRFIGTKINYAKITLSSENEFIQYSENP